MTSAIQRFKDRKSQKSCLSLRQHCCRHPAWVQLLFLSQVARPSNLPRCLQETATQTEITRHSDNIFSVLFKGGYVGLWPKYFCRISKTHLLRLFWPKNSVFLQWVDSFAVFFLYTSGWRQDERVDQKRCFKGEQKKHVLRSLLDEASFLWRRLLGQRWPT